METTENTYINFAWLANADIPFISKQISKEQAFCICTSAAEQGHVSASEVLTLWISKLRIVHSLQNFSEEDWRRLTLCCRKNFENIVNNEVEIDTTETKLISWLKASNNFLEQVQNDEKNLHFTGVYFFLKFILDTAQRCCTIFKKKISNLDGKPQIELFSYLHNSSLKLMWSCLEGRGEISSVDYCAIIPLIITLCANTSNNPFIDIKIKVETWKYLAKFALRCAEYKTTLNDSQWPRIPMSALIEEVKNNILEIKDKELKEDIKYVEQYLRVTGFYVKIVYKMATVFQHSDFPIARDYFDILLMTITAQRSFENSIVLALIKTHVLSGLTDIMSLVFKNYELIQLISHHVAASAEFCFELVVAYLHACTLNDDVEYFSSNAELFPNIFSRIFRDGDIFVNANYFDEVINIYATLTILDSTQAFLRNMQRFVVKGNPALSFACTEVLITASSCVDKSSDDLLTTLEFWLQTRNRFAKFSSNFRCLNIDRMIGHYFKLCLCKMSISEIQIQLSLCFSSLCYATDYIDKAELESLRLKASSKKFCELLEEPKRSGMPMENYYETVSYMYELMRYKSDISEEVQKQISNLLEKVCKVMTKHNFTFERLLSSGLSLICGKNVANDTRLQILEALKYVVENGRNFHMLAFWLFLEVCSYQPKDSKVYNTAQAILNYIIVPDIIQVSIFKKTTLATCAPIVVAKYYPFIECRSKCTICAKPYSMRRKRLRSEVDYEDTRLNLEETIQNIGYLVAKLKHYSKHIKKNQVEQLNNVVLDIKEITGHG